MSLSNDLISQFVKITNDNTRSKKETIVYGTTVEYKGAMYVNIDGSDLLTPITTTADLKSGERVVVMIKNHSAIVTGNVTSPSASSNSVNDLSEKVLKIVAGEVTAEQLNAQIARIDYLAANMLTADNLDAKVATIDALNAVKAEIDDLEADKLSAEQADLKYANIDFSNIEKATMEWFYAHSGLIENVTIGDSTITGNLVGVTITGDLIEGNTIKAEKLVIKGEDGFYYKLNTDGVSIEEEQTNENSLNGTIIQAKSITASKVSVSDLVAFDATIGGFHITDSMIYSEVKDSEDNVTRGIYMDSDGQINFGDASNFIKYYRDEDGTYKLAISAASILYALNGKQYSIADIGRIGDYVHVGVYEDEPCIELGESDSDFRLIITNTRILFMEGSSVPAYINNQSLHITKAVIEEEIQQGEFVWKVRQNGNMGLMWKGEA